MNVERVRDNQKPDAPAKASSDRDAPRTRLIAGRLTTAVAGKQADARSSRGATNSVVLSCLADEGTNRLRCLGRALNRHPVVISFERDKAGVWDFFGDRSSHRQRTERILGRP
jgi:hypothetical protein